MIDFCSFVFFCSQQKGKDEKKSPTGPRVIIYVIGGITYSEMRTAYELSKKFGRQVTIGKFFYFFFYKKLSNNKNFFFLWFFFLQKIVKQQKILKVGTVLLLQANFSKTFDLSKNSNLFKMWLCLDLDFVQNNHKKSENKTQSSLHSKC